MRRLAVWCLAPATVAAIVLGGCSSGGSGTPRAAGSGTATPSANASPSDAASRANQDQVCAAVNKAIAEGAAAFGTDLGTLVGHLSGGNNNAASAAKAKALADLRKLATNIRTAAAPATDPPTKAALQSVADNVSAMANDPRLLANIHKTSDVTPVIEKLTRATDPLTRTCTS